MPRIALYCDACGHFVGMGRECKRPDAFRWLEKCDRCVERERQVEELEAIWAAGQLCAAPDCTETFTPGRARQRFCSDRCRKRTHRRLVAARVNGSA